MSTPRGPLLQRSCSTRSSRSTGGAGRACFQNEIIWAYDYGARATQRWPAKHDNILWYTKDPAHYTFNLDASDRIPYMAPGLVGAEKAARGKTPTDVWWHTIVSPTGKEKTGYPTQKPLGILERIVRVHSNPGDTVLDFFAGSGTTGLAAGIDALSSGTSSSWRRGTTRFKFCFNSKGLA
jgi:site-specific DNA-methyltransferase (adenine-specific)